MRIIGIICEYNPFHNGHKYQIDKIRSMYEDCLIIAICSSCFTQRADVSIVHKWDKAKIAIDNGIDLFVELPFAFATQDADRFAKGAIGILNKLKVDTLVFGAESYTAKELIDIANVQLNDKDKYDTLVKKYLSLGENYPTSMSKALIDLCGKTVNKPNDLLGLSYVKAILDNKYDIEPVVIKRIDNYHNDNTINNIASASYIRKLFKENKDVSIYIPKDTLKYLHNYDINSFFPYLKYQIIANGNRAFDIGTYDEDLCIRIRKYIDESNSWEELVNKVKTKRYTYNRINRTLLHILIGYTCQDFKDSIVIYDDIRVLGFNKKGQKHLHDIKKNVEIFTHNTKYHFHTFDIEKRITNIYSLVLNNNLDIDEYNHKPIIKN